jgi:hypothetical protein
MTLTARIPETSNHLRILVEFNLPSQPGNLELLFSASSFSEQVGTLVENTQPMRAAAL